MVDKEYGVVKDGFRFIFCTRILRVCGNSGVVVCIVFGVVEFKKTEKAIGSFFMIEIGEEFGAIVFLGIEGDFKELVGGGYNPLLKEFQE
jgi:hypothetical protein